MTLSQIISNFLERLLGKPMLKPNPEGIDGKVCMVSMVVSMVSNIFRSAQKGTEERCRGQKEVSSSSISMEDLPQEMLVKIGSYCPPDPVYSAMFGCSKRLTIAARTNLQDAIRRMAIKAKVVNGRVVDKKGKNYGPAGPNVDGKVLIMKKGILIESDLDYDLERGIVQWGWKITNPVYNWREDWKGLSKMVSFVTGDNVIIPKITSFKLRADKRPLGRSMYRSRIAWKNTAISDLPPTQIGEIVGYDDDDNIIVENQLGDRIVCFNVNNENGKWGKRTGTASPLYEFEASQRPTGLGMAEQVAIINHFSYIKSDKQPLTALGLDNKGYEGFVLNTDGMPNCINLDLAEDVIIEEPVEIPA